MAAEMPETPAPMMARSRVSLSWLPGSKLLSSRMDWTARAPVSAENFRSGTPVRSPTMKMPGTLQVPSSLAAGAFSTLPAGHFP